MWLMQKKIGISGRNQKQYNLTLFDGDIKLLEDTIKTVGKDIDFERADLYEDIRTGTTRIKKLKLEYTKNNQGVGKAKYSIDKTPQIFIRRAVESSDEEEEEKNNKYKNSDRKRKYKQATKEAVVQPKFSSEDFPTLN